MGGSVVRALTVFAGTRVRFPAPMYQGSHLPVTPASGDPMSLAGPHKHLYAYMHTPVGSLTHVHTIKNSKLNLRNALE